MVAAVLRISKEQIEWKKLTLVSYFGLNIESGGGERWIDLDDVTFVEVGVDWGRSGLC